MTHKPAKRGVANQTFTATGTTAPVLAAQAQNEQRWLAKVLERHNQLAVIAWQQSPPTGAAALAQLVRTADLVGATSAPTDAEQEPP